MYKLAILTLFTLSTLSVYALHPMDATLAAAKGEAITIQSSCITVPPITAEQISWCTAHYVIYNQYLTQLQAPMPLTLNSGTDGYVSPYASSPYDICRFEPGRLINGKMCL